MPLPKKSAKLRKEVHAAPVTLLGALVEGPPTLQYTAALSKPAHLALPLRGSRTPAKGRRVVFVGV